MNTEQQAALQDAIAYELECKAAWDETWNMQPFDYGAEKAAYETYQAAIAATRKI